MPVKLEGMRDPNFGSVKNVFGENLESRGEVGASAAVTLDGVL